MFEGKSIVDAARQIAAISLATVIIAIGPLYAAHAAQSKGGKATSEEGATSPAVAEFIALLGDPKVQKWLEEQHAAEVSHKPAPDAETSSVSDYFDSRVRATREHITALGSALPDLPNQCERGVGLLQAEIPRRGTVLFLVLVFAGLGLGVEWLFRKATQKTRQRLDGFPMETVNDRLRLVAARFAFAFGVVVAFAIGSIGPFLALDWPPLLSKMVLGYLVALLVTRIAVVVGHLLLAPDAEYFRIIPMDTVAARFWCRRLSMFVGWFAFGYVTVGLLNTLGFSVEGRQLVAYVLGLGLLAIALEAVWRRPVAPADATEAPLHGTHHLGRGAQNALLSIGIVLLWGLWVARAMPAFWLVLVVMTLPLALGVTRRAVQHL